MARTFQGIPFRPAEQSMISDVAVYRGPPESHPVGTKDCRAEWRVARFS
jgi:hypothetical protein